MIAYLSRLFKSVYISTDWIEFMKITHNFFQLLNLFLYDELPTFQIPTCIRTPCTKFHVNLPNNTQLQCVFISAASLDATLVSRPIRKFFSGSSLFAGTKFLQIHNPASRRHYDDEVDKTSWSNLPFRYPRFRSLRVNSPCTWKFVASPRRFRDMTNRTMILRSHTKETFTMRVKALYRLKLRSQSPGPFPESPVKIAKKNHQYNPTTA